MLNIFWDTMPAIGTVAAWVVTVSLLALGFVGTLVPFLLGHLVLFFAAGIHCLILRPDSGVVEIEDVA